MTTSVSAGRLSRGRAAAGGAAVLGALVLFLVASACSGPASRSDTRQRAGVPGATSAAPAPSVGPSAPAAARPRVVILGDSLTAGYGLASKDAAFPALLQKEIDRAGLQFEIVNMGVSGDTTAGGLRRLDWAMEGDVRVLVVALGGNDGLRGLAPAQMRSNLATIIDEARRRGARVLLCGMEAPPNLGAKYTEEFRAVYKGLAEEKGVAFVPFLLDGVAGLPQMNQPDGIHPNDAGALRVAAHVWTTLRPMLEARTTS